MTPPPERFLAQWAAGLAIVGAVAAWRVAGPAAEPARPVEPRGGPAAWYLAVRLPPITASYEAGVETMRARYAAWLRALRRAGFVPVTLSAARRRLSDGSGLPRRAVVSVFEPGWRRTLRIVEPVLTSEGWPAVWLTDREAMRSANREFVTFHKARMMERSGWWDVGYSSAGGYDLRGLDARFPLGERGRPPWSEVEGTFALNRSSATTGLQILDVKQDWTAEDLVNRLEAEAPIEQDACLTQAAVQDKLWGVPAAAAALDQCPPMTAQAPADRRSARLFWLGTAGAPSFALEACARALTGELRLHLRLDEAAGRELTVRLDERAWSVEERDGGSVELLLRAPRSGPVRLRLALDGRRLTIAPGGARPWTSPELATPPRGLLSASVFAKVRGAARVEDLRLLFKPSSPPIVAGDP